MSTATWRKSTSSDASGGNCVEVGTDWWKSTHSRGDGGGCLEVPDGVPEVVPVRDSKVRAGPVRMFRVAA
ncbi:DUF397 domain-containing protein [Streptomyces sp. NPDC092903]|uniref:DUF397 domain-containing protein n=1 Tax=Streptomyces sp. NPDC092903 TaxID=3366017 RepID=UPI003815C2B4